MDDKTGRLGQQWYYCLKHNAVEGEEGCPNSVRMGPYDSEEAAANALETARERNEAWDAADRNWKDGHGPASSDGDDEPGSGSHGSGTPLY